MVRNSESRNFADFHGENTPTMETNVCTLWPVLTSSMLLLIPQMAEAATVLFLLRPTNLTRPVLATLNQGKKIHSSLLFGSQPQFWSALLSTTLCMFIFWDLQSHHGPKIHKSSNSKASSKI
jgi:hypothetical protein